MHIMCVCSLLDLYTSCVCVRTSIHSCVIISIVRFIYYWYLRVHYTSDDSADKFKGVEGEGEVERERGSREGKGK